MASPFGLPPAWDPGFAIPDNVRDEGLARHAFVTEMQPRGSFDNPKVGTAGYAVPKYVLAEGLGRSTYTTKMPPRGSYAGPAVPQWLNKRPTQLARRGSSTFVTGMSGLGSDEVVGAVGFTPVPEPYASFGDKAAQTLLATVGSLPASHRMSHLKAAMDKLDKSLWKRTGDIMKEYRAQGFSTQQAFPAALSRAMAAGLLAETLALGTGKKKVKAAVAPGTMVSMGCYGPLGLGDDAPVTRPGLAAVIGGVKSLVSQAFCEAPVIGGVPYTWDAAKGALRENLDWRSKGVPIPGCKDPSTVPVITSTPRDPKLYFQIKMPDGSMPPMIIRSNNKAIAWSILGDNTTQIAAGGHRASQLPQKAKDWLKKVLSSGEGDYATFGKVAENFHIADGQQRTWESQLLSILRGLGMSARPTVNFSVLRGDVPLARAKHPVTGEDYEVRLILDQNQPQSQDSDLHIPSEMGVPFANLDKNPLALYVVWAPKRKSLLEQIWNGLTWLVTEFVEVLGAALGAIGDLVCQTMAAPNAAAGAAVGGAAVGVPPQAAAGGANLAKGLCGGQAPPYLPPQDSGWGLPLVIAAAVGGVAYLATRK